MATFADKLQFIADAGLSRHLLWFAESMRPGSAGEFAWEIAHLPENLADYLAWRGWRAGIYPIVLWTLSHIEVVIYECKVTLFPANECGFLLKGPTDILAVLRYIRMFRQQIVEIDIFDENYTAGSEEQARLTPAKVLGRPDGSLVNVPPEIAGIIGEFLWNGRYGSPDDLLNFARVYRGFAAGKLRKIADNSRHFADRFCVMHCLLDMRALHNIKTRRIPTYVATDSVVRVQDGRVIIGNNAFTIADVAPHRARFIGKTLEKYSGMPDSRDIFLMLRENYEFRLL